MRAATWVLLLGLSGAGALAEPRPARDTADVGARGSYSIGIFDPLRYALSDRVEIETHPLLFFLDPNVGVRVALLKPAPDPANPRGFLRLTYEAGLSMPTWGLRLLKGLAYPAWSTTTDDFGWMMIPRVGLVLSGNPLVESVLTGRVEVSFQWPLGPNNLTRLDTFLAPVDLFLAAPLTGFLGRVGLAYDHALGDRVRLRAAVDGYLTGSRAQLAVSGTSPTARSLAALSPLVFTAQLGIDIAVFRQSRVAIGAWYANYDQGRAVVVTQPDGYSRTVRVRSNEVLPMIDFIWAGD